MQLFYYAFVLCNCFLRIIVLCHCGSLQYLIENFIELQGSDDFVSEVVKDLFVLKSVES